MKMVQEKEHAFELRYAGNKEPVTSDSEADRD